MSRITGENYTSRSNIHAQQIAQAQYLTAQVKRRYISYIFKFIVVCITIVFILGEFGKAYISGVEDFFTYFTNWSWSVQVLFYSLVLVGFIINDVWNFIVFMLFLPVLGITFYVYIILQVIVTTRPRLLEDLEEIDPAIVELGNELYHPLPVIIILLFLLAFHEGITMVYAEFMTRNGRIIRAINALWQIFFPSLLCLIYSIFHNPIDVYGVRHLSYVNMLLIGIFVNLVVSGIAFHSLFPYTPLIITAPGSFYSHILDDSERFSNTNVRSIKHPNGSFQYAVV